MDDLIQQPEEPPVEAVDTSTDESGPEDQSSDLGDVLEVGEVAVVSFKIVGDKADVKFQTRLTNGMVSTFKIEGTQLPLPESLVLALEGLKEDLAREIEVPLTPENDIVVNQIVCGFKGTRQHFKILGMRGRRKSNNPMNVSSDLKWDSHPDDKQVMDTATVFKMRQAFQEVNGYVAMHLQPGGQGDLFNKERKTVAEEMGVDIRPDGDSIPQLPESRHDGDSPIF